MAKGKTFGKAEESTDQPAASRALPAWKAFIVQFTLETGVEDGAFSGRVEHLSTGQRVHFGSTQELLEFVDAVLRQPRSVHG